MKVSFLHYYRNKLALSKLHASYEWCMWSKLGVKQNLINGRWINFFIEYLKFFRGLLMPPRGSWNGKKNLKIHVFGHFLEFFRFFTPLLMKYHLKPMFFWKYGQSYYRKWFLHQCQNPGTFSPGGQTPKFCKKKSKNISFRQFWAFEIYRIPKNHHLE